VNVVLIAAVVAYAFMEAIRGDGIQLAEGSVSTQARDLLWFAVVCGLASFATIETLKRIAGIRGLFNRRQLEIWLEERTPQGRGADVALHELLDAMGLGDPVSQEQDEDASRGAVNRGDYKRVFNLPVEQLAAQISSAVDVAVLSPERYRSLIGTLIGGEAGMKVAASLEQVKSADKRADDEGADDDRRFQLAQRVRAGVDQLQISLGERWRQYVQGAALWIAGLYGIGLAHAADRSTESRYVLAALLLGGLFAWLARDVAAVIERMRR
jgi:hypothetical protein